MCMSFLQHPSVATFPVRGSMQIGHSSIKIVDILLLYGVPIVRTLRHQNKDLQLHQTAHAGQSCPEQPKVLWNGSCLVY